MLEIYIHKYLDSSRQTLLNMFAIEAGVENTDHSFIPASDYTIQVPFNGDIKEYLNIVVGESILALKDN